MNKLLLVLFAFLTTPLFAASPIIYYGTHSKDLTTAGLITQALQAGSTGQFNVSTVGLVSTTNGLHVGSSAQFQVDGSGNVVTTGSVSAGNLLSVDGNGHSFSFAGANLTSNYTVQVPATSGTVGQYMATDGSGNLNWRAPPTEKNYLAAGTNDSTGWAASGAGITCTTTTSNLPDASVGTALAVTGVSGAAGTEYCFYNFDIDQADGSKVLKLVEDQLPISGYVASDFRLDVYSCTVAWSGTPATTCSGTATRLALSTDNSSGVTALPALTGTLTPPPTYSTPAYASAPHLQARIGLNGASTHQMNFAQVLTGPGTVVQSAAVTQETVQSGLVFSSAWGGVTNKGIYSRRVGNKLHVRGTVVVVAPTSGILYITLPTGLAIDTSLFDAQANAQKIGSMQRIKSSGTTAPNDTLQNVVFYDGSDPNDIFIAVNQVTSAAIQYDKSVGTAVFNAGDIANFDFEIPIAEWAGQGTVFLGSSGSANSSLRVGTSNGYGSTNTTIRRFTNTLFSLGQDITFADSATAGSSFTVGAPGIYTITYTDEFSAGASMGISLNSSQLTTNIAAITATDRLAMFSVTAANSTGAVSVTVKLAKGDVLRAHADGTTSGSSTARATFTVTKVVNEAACSVGFAAASATAPGLVSGSVQFGVYSNANQTGLTSGTTNKVALNTKEFDSGGWFDATTNYRFTPQKAGTYHISAAAQTNNSSNVTTATLILYKNGSAFKTLASYQNSGTTTGVVGLSGSVDVAANGSDYFELYLSQTGASTFNILSGEAVTYMTGSLVP